MPTGEARHIDRLGERPARGRPRRSATPGARPPRCTANERNEFRGIVAPRDHGAVKSARPASIRILRPPQGSSSSFSERPHRSQRVGSRTLPSVSSSAPPAACIRPPHRHGSGYSSQHSGHCTLPIWWLDSSPTANRVIASDLLARGGAASSSWVPRASAKAAGSRTGAVIVSVIAPACTT